MRIFNELREAIQENTAEIKKLRMTETENKESFNKLIEITNNAYREISNYFIKMRDIEVSREEASKKRQDDLKPTEDDLRF